LGTSSGPTRIAVDAMGGDHAPAEIVKGAVRAARRGGVHVTLVGDPERVEAELSRHDAAGLPIGVAPSQGVITEGESPVVAARRKPRASILVSTGLVKEGRADACVTMGSTGAAMASAAVVLGVVDGLDRPALGGPIFGLAPETLVIDLGSNLDCRPSQLVSFAVIGDVFARTIWGVENPKVALLSVGAERGKGNKQVRETTTHLESSGLNFIGNVEPGDLTSGLANVVVCDGFVGNVVMKLTEGLGRSFADLVRGENHQRDDGDGRPGLDRRLYELSNVVEAYGGGPLFGVNGVSVVGHGRARADAVAKAINTAKLLVETGFVSEMNDELARVRGRAGSGQ
jgi:glycerol-3-phosphate acyltransferase PlsX